MDTVCVIIVVYAISFQVDLSMVDDRLFRSYIGTHRLNHILQLLGLERELFAENSYQNELGYEYIIFHIFLFNCNL